MTDRAESVKSLESFVVTQPTTKKRMIFEATLSTNDTVTLNDFTTIASMHLAKKSDGAEISCTKATNVITVTEGSLTDVAVVGFAVGT